MNVNLRSLLVESDSWCPVSKADCVEDAGNITASKDAANGTQITFPRLNSSPLPAEFILRAVKWQEKKEQMVLSFSYLSPILPFTDFNWKNWTENRSSLYLWPQSPQFLTSRFEFYQKQILRKGNELQWFIWEEIPGNTVKGVRKWNRKGRSRHALTPEPTWWVMEHPMEAGLPAPWAPTILPFLTMKGGSFSPLLSDLFSSVEGSRSEAGQVLAL